MNVPSLYSLPLYSRATSAVNGFPNGIGPVSRTLSVGGVMEDFWSPIGDQISGIFRPAVENIAKTQWVRGVILAKERLGYVKLDTVIIGDRAFVKMRNPQGVPVYIDDMGVETVVTEQNQGAEKRIDPITGQILTGTAIGISVLAAAAALFFILRRK